MTPQESISSCFSNYATFKGRAPRSEYWWFYLFVLLGILVLKFVFPLAAGIFSLAIIIPTLAAASRRLHDTDRSGWWQLISLLPIVGPFILIYWLAIPGIESTRFDN
jgi:uncharacterized membrane protein YhaH (DUF805 family)